jgi:hemoglobin/transferrin/lactoferrin receptor protein
MELAVRINLLVLCISVALASSSVAAVEAGETTDAPVKTLDTITVSATRTARALEQVPASVSVINRRDMDNYLAEDIKDLIRYEPGVSVSNSAGRFGLSGFRIRGLEANRVLIELDGIAIADAFSIGSFSNAGRDLVDIDTLKRVEILRGPSSSLYGSDALGGVVSFTTKDPSDYLGDANNIYTGLRTGWQSENESSTGAATFAYRLDNLSGLLQWTRRDGQQLENQGKNDAEDRTRTAPNPQSTVSNALLAKAVLQAADSSFRFTLDSNRSETQTNVLSALGLQSSAGRTINVTQLSGDDSQQRSRFSIEQRFGAFGAFADDGRWQLYHQRSETRQNTRENRNSVASGAAINPVTRIREFAFDQRLSGFEAVLSKNLASTDGGTEHLLTYGVDMQWANTIQQRDGISINRTTGAVSNTVLPDVFPVRDFPLSQTWQLAAFIQDEISFDGGRLRLTPALRIDHYRLNPKLDSIFAEDNPGVVPVSLRQTRFSPKLGAVWQFSDAWSGYGQVAQGFRAPPYNDANLGFTNLAFGYTAIPNPDLKPETSQGVELGLRAAGEWGSASLAVYHNRYDDFIESLRFIGMDTSTGLSVFQSQNISKAVIEGAEAKLVWSMASVSSAWDGWTFQTAIAWSRGENTLTRAPLNSIDPLRMSLGLGYQGQRWSIELAGNVAQSKKNVMPLDATGALAFVPPGYAVFDLYARFKLLENATLRLGIFNLGDRRYWDWADVPGIAANSNTLDRYTRPGRSFSGTIAFDW